MVTASPLGWDPLPGKTSRGLRWVVALLALLGVASALGLAVHLPYYLEEPGSATPVTPLIQTDAAHRHPLSGEVLLATVALTSRVTPLQLVGAWLNPNANIVSEKTLTGGTPAPQFNQDNAILMDQSKQEAVVLGLRRLGYAVPEHGDGVMVVSVDPRSASEGRLKPGDVIVAADGKPVALAQDLTSIIKPEHPGAVLTLTVKSNRAAATHPEVIPLTSCPDDVCPSSNGQRPYLGIGLQTHNDHFDYPFKASINLNDVGGPSAGLAFTLGVLNLLGNGRLTGNHKVACTGTIDLDGNVGPIGGIALKTVAVERAGADVFLVPKDTGIPGDDPQYSAALAKARGHHLKVYAVGTLDDALRVLRSLGGDLGGITPAPAPTGA